MSLSTQEREDAMTIGRLQSENEQNKSNIDTLFTKLDALTKEMHTFKTEMMVEVSKVSTKLGLMIGIASILSPVLFSIINKYFIEK